MTRGEMMTRMTAREYDEWMAFLTLYPIGERGAYVRAGTIAATVANVFRDAKKQPRAFAPADAFPWLAEGEAEPDELTPDEAAAHFIAPFAAAGLVVRAEPEG